jgi:tripartite-type tricarboxylate transporter receptor subunit TctC
MRKALQDVLARDSVRQRLEAVGAVANLSTPDEFRNAIVSDIKSFQEVAKKAGLEAK